MNNWVLPNYRVAPSDGKVLRSFAKLVVQLHYSLQICMLMLMLCSKRWIWSWSKNHGESCRMYNTWRGKVWCWGS